MKELKQIIAAACSAITALITKTGSRKFLIMLIATHAMYFGILPAEYWAMIALAWQGIEGGIDGLSAYRSRRAPRVTKDPWQEDEFVPDSQIRGIEGVAV